jgi:protein TonB
VAASACIVTSLHAGIAAYAYLMPREEEVVEEAEGAFMLEVAPVEVAASQPSNVQGPSGETAQTAVAEKKPTEDVPEVTPPKEEPLPVAADPELAVPIHKPVEEVKEEKEEIEKPVEKQEVKEEKEEEPETETAEAREASVAGGAPPSVAAQESDKPAARRQGTTDRMSDPVLSWSKLMNRHLGQHRNYPNEARNAGHQGAVQVAFRIDRKGNVLSARLVKASSSKHLDAEAVALFYRASPLPEPPDEVRGETLEYVMAINFNLK